MTVNLPSGSTLKCDTWLWDDMPLNSPGGSTLQCGRWLWDDMPRNSPKRQPYLNSTSCFDFDHITAVDMLFGTSLQNFIHIGLPSAEKIDVMSIFKMADLSHLGFRGPIMGSLKSSCTTFYRSSMDTIAVNCLVFCIFASRSKMADLRHLGFRGPVMVSLKSPCTTSYSSSIETIALNC